MGRLTDFLERFKNPERYKEKQEKERQQKVANLEAEEKWRKAREEAEKKTQGKQD